MARTFVTNGLTRNRRRFQVVKSNPNYDVKGIKLGDKKMKFSKQSNDFYVNDPVLAKEIHDTHGQNGTDDVVVIPIEANMEDGHLRSVGGSTRWANAWEEFEKRRKDKESEQ